METTELRSRFVKARRQIIRNEFRFLNPKQQEAVMTTEGPLLLLAGAGSGKTTVLINRVANLIRYGRASDSQDVPENIGEEDLALLERCAADGGEPSAEAARLCALDPVEPWRVLAITFTNKAAGELKTRLVARLGESANDVWAYTFHSACVRILRNSGDVIGVPSSFTIYDTADSRAVMKRIMKSQGMDDKPSSVRSVLSAISRAKDALLSPRDYAGQAASTGDMRGGNIAGLYEEYQRRLADADALDFDDLIFRTVQLLRKDQETRSYYQRLFRYVLVDEYQDTSNLQYLLASLLAGGKDNICVVGDDDQSIYRFRGATIENILSFERRYKNARCIKLEQNYRSTGHILAAANAVISNNQGRKGKELWTDAEDGEKLSLYVAADDDAEADYVSSKILSGLTDGMALRDFAVLYRMNAQSNRLEYSLKRNGIPYRVVGGMRFFDRAEVKDMTAYLSTVNNPDDDLRLARIINNPPRGIGGTTVDKMRAIAASDGCSLFHVLAHSGDYASLRSANPRLQRFYALLYELHDASGSMPLDQFYDFLLERTGYMESLGKSDEDLAKVENVNELRSNIVKYKESAPEPTLAGFLDEIALYTDLDNLSDGDDSVALMTMHSAKGLEFPWVFIVGMEDGIFPSYRSIGEEEEMEEERRLCYVALTRAKKRLFMTAARRRRLNGVTTSTLISRFVDEIPPDRLVRSDQARDWPSPDIPSDRTYAQPDRTYGQPDRTHATGYSDRRQSRYGAAARSGGTAPAAARGERAAPVAASRPPRTAPVLSVGDRVRHKAFGEGRVKEIVELPGDRLLTVTFETGDRKLLIKTAGALMEKLQQ